MVPRGREVSGAGGIGVGVSVAVGVACALGVAVGAAVGESVGVAAGSGRAHAANSTVVAATTLKDQTKDSGMR